MTFVADRVPRTFLKFVVTGIVSMVTHVGLVALLVEFFDVPPQPANMVGFLASVMVSFFGNHYWSFRGNDQTARVAFIRYTVIITIGILYNGLVMNLFLTRLGLGYEFGLAAIVASWPFVSFTLASLWAFSAHREGR